MQLSQKAVLLNTLVFPGTGHFILKRHYSAIFYAGVSIIALSVIFVKILSLVYAIVDKLNSSLESGEAMSLLGILGNSFSETNTQYMNIAFIIYIAIWLIAIFDAYRIGKNMD